MNAAKVCDHDHRLLHEGGWTLRRSDDPTLRARWDAAPGDTRDTWVWTRPDGKIYTRPVGTDPPITLPDTGQLEPDRARHYLAFVAGTDIR